MESYSDTENKAMRILEENDLKLCTRHWSAWGHDTMTEDDFVNASGEDGLVETIAADIDQMVDERVAEIVTLLEDAEMQMPDDLSKKIIINVIDKLKEDY